MLIPISFSHQNVQVKTALDYLKEISEQLEMIATELRIANGTVKKTNNNPKKK